MPAPQPALFPPAAVRLRLGAIADRSPADRQAGRGGGRYLALETIQAVLRLLTGTRRFPRDGADGRADRALGVKGAPDRDDIEVEQDHDDRPECEGDCADAPLVPAGYAVHMVVVPFLDRRAEPADVPVGVLDQRLERRLERHRVREIPDALLDDIHAG